MDLLLKWRTCKTAPLGSYIVSKTYQDRTSRHSPSLRGVLAGVILSGSIMLGGCAHYGAVQFVTDPPGAEIINLRDDTTVGTTPKKVWWKESDGQPKHVTVQFVKEGYREKITNIWVNMLYSSKGEALANAKPLEITLEKKKEDK